MLRERFAALGGVLQCGQIAKALGVYCAGHPDVNPKTGKRMKAPRGLKREGWKGWANSQAPFGTEPTKRHQAKFVSEPDASAAKSKLVLKRRHRGAKALTKIGQMPDGKLPKLAKKYAWQT